MHVVLVAILDYFQKNEADYSHDVSTSRRCVVSTINPNESFEVFFDGACRLCTKEINMLRALDKHDRIIFTDIASRAFDAERETGLTYDELMGEIHGRFADGRLVTGVEVFRQLYGRAGLAWAMWTTRLPGVSQTLDLSYRYFAKNRLKWTGRCEEGSCRVPEPNVRAAE